MSDYFFKILNPKNKNCSVVEHLTHIPRVEGSNPEAGTRINKMKGEGSSGTEWVN
jgi:hypothetical protein